MPVNPTGQDLKRYLAEDPGGPVVMLNLLKLRDGGREAYGRYVTRITGYLDGIGAEVVYVGDCASVLVAPAGHDWDVLLLVRYPSRTAFSRMVADPAYQEFTHLRTESVQDAVLQATVPWTDSQEKP